MARKLEGMRIAILVTNGFEQVELTEPRRALDEAGAITHIVAPEGGTIRAWDRKDWGSEFEVDRTVESASAEEYDALLLPGGVLNPDKLRMDDRAVTFARSFFEDEKPVAAICHGPQILIDAGVVEGRRMTSYQAVRKDLENAGAKWIDQEVVIDRGLITSRKPDDIPIFNEAVVHEFSLVRTTEPA